MGRPLITPQAAADVEEAWDHIAPRNLKAADRLVDRFVSSAERHAQFPLLGEPRDDIAAGLRCFVVPPYVAFYRVEGEDVRILRFLHGRRDARRIMKDEPAES